MPLHLSDSSEPEPDILIAFGNDSNYNEHHPTPTDAALVIEVANTSINYDTRDKALLYAQAGIADYWVVLLPTEEVMVFRQPTADGYAEVQTLGIDQSIAPLCAPATIPTVASLFRQRG